ncbi:MAG: hypothetical protein KGL39_47395 [Patescibacteria group bacterium]|nr:hypothetical protein [Patescibacteria group bacterium]
MPLDPHASVGTDIKEFRTGNTYRHTEEKFGKKRAEKQALAVALHTHDDPPGGTHHVATLTAAKRDKMPKSEFGQPEKKGFPMNDKKHDRLAISGATRSEHAGNISEAEADKIKAEARHKLHEGDGGDPPAHDHKAAVAKMHPEHVHKLVKHAAAGHFGPEAQKMAQQAQQAPEGDGDADDQPQGGGRDMSSIFGGGSAPAAAPAPASRASMFAGRGGY